MEEICLKAYGKVNIGLDITGKRPDGYHLLKMVMQTVNVYDDVRVRKTGQGITVRMDRDDLPTDERNLAFRAAQRLFAAYDLPGGVEISITKRIPVGGGMAGGSTDGAAVILAVDALYDLHMTAEEKDAFAVQLGADVPFCLRKGTYLAEGIGEILTRLPALPKLTLLICAPGFPVSTPWAYRTFDQENTPYRPDMDRLLSAIRRGDTADLFASMGNSLEPIAAAQFPAIETIRQAMLDEGAGQAMMTGSGSTVFGLFTEETAAQAACDKLRKTIDCSDIFVTTSIEGD